MTCAQGFCTHCSSSNSHEHVIEEVVTAVNARDDWSMDKLSRMFKVEHMNK